jgi:prepilin-type N-terminal cleavage/methylation domain-containing protein/prepilin-type processing-associated H-X9-DG protein
MRTFRFRAFTLIELLVVIAIIAILAAILFPVFAQAKLAAKKTAGLAQMKQIGTALMMYEGDFDDGLPTWDWYYCNYVDRDKIWSDAGSPQTNKRMWDALLLPYVKDGSFDKQAAVASSEWAGIWKSPGIEYNPKGGRSLGMNQLIFWDLTGANDPAATPDTSVGTGYYRWFNMSEMDRVAETMFVGDSGIGGRYEPVYNFNGHDETFITKPARPSYARPWRYGMDSANYAFLDGHASSMKGDKIYPNASKTTKYTTWTTAQRAQNYCAAGRYQAGTPAARQQLINVAAAAGVNCNLN